MELLFSSCGDCTFLCTVLFISVCVREYTCSEKKVYDDLQVCHSSATFNEISI